MRTMGAACLQKLGLLLNQRYHTNVLLAPAIPFEAARSVLQSASGQARSMLAIRTWTAHCRLTCCANSSATACIAREQTYNIGTQVKDLVQKAYTRAQRILTQHERDLHTLAKELLDKETLSGEQIKKLLKIAVPRQHTAVASS